MMLVTKFGSPKSKSYSCLRPYILVFTNLTSQNLSHPNPPETWHFTSFPPNHIWTNPSKPTTDPNVKDLKCLPFFILGCNKLLVLLGETYAERLWCVWELYIFYCMCQSDTSKVRLQPLGTESVRKLRNFQAENAHCRDKADEKKLRSVIKKEEKRFEKDVQELAMKLGNVEVWQESSNYSVSLDNAPKPDMKNQQESANHSFSPDGYHLSDYTIDKRRVNVYSDACRVDCPDSFTGTTFKILQELEGSCKIPETQWRAIKLCQLEAVIEHTNRRLESEVWIGQRPGNAGEPWEEHEITKLEQINLYHLTAYCINPATAVDRNSMVEFMASGPQHPDFFVSHWSRLPNPVGLELTMLFIRWGEPVLHFILCLQQHAKDHGLEKKLGWHDRDQHTRLLSTEEEPHPGYLGGRSPQYWVCAYALNQWKLHIEIGEKKLEEMPFYLALKMSKGTISIIDENGICFNRIWCVFELYYSLAGGEKKDEVYFKNHTYELYTTYGKPEDMRAVGITYGLAVADRDAHSKSARERQFPSNRLVRGIDFKSADGEASVEKDKQRILDKIGDDSQTLDTKVHSAVAASTLSQCINAAQCGTKYQCEGEEQRVATIAIDALVKENTCEVLSVRTLLTSIPEDLCNLMPLRKLQLRSCTKLIELPEAMVSLSALSELTLCHCPNLMHLPDLPSALVKLALDDCSALSSVPDTIGQLAKLTHLSLRRCSSITKLPARVTNLDSLVSLNLDGCKSLEVLPAGMSTLTKLTRLDLCNCKSLKALPNLSEIDGLKTVGTGLSCNKEGHVYVHGICAKVVHAWKACGYAPGCHDGLGESYGAWVWLFPWLRKAIQT